MDNGGSTSSQTPQEPTCDPVRVYLRLISVEEKVQNSWLPDFVLVKTCICLAFANGGKGA